MMMEAAGFTDVSTYTASHKGRQYSS